MSKLTAVSVLAGSIGDIEKGYWICGELCQLDAYAGGNAAKKKADVKTMACAVGLISLFSNHTTTSSLWLRGRNLKFKYALYPEDSNAKGKPIDPAGRRALELLYLAIPKKERIALQTVESGGWPDYLQTLIPHTVEDAPTAVLSGAVVGYNDGVIGSKRSPSKAALAWFKRAHKLALKEQEDYWN